MQESWEFEPQISGCFLSWCSKYFEKLNSNSLPTKPFARGVIQVICLAKQFKLTWVTIWQTRFPGQKEAIGLLVSRSNCARRDLALQRFGMLIRIHIGKLGLHWRQTVEFNKNMFTLILGI
eukprot:TRINITY_DN4988_c2_g1_i1.p1 TRINITY_DN4988_c2_g1~~TRINITY_DN4988_c2_g1_i1.p1  ORF type:complete len:121 (+),score=5.01 TRINITY_DN4988_c2_g1_i1:194-556(+)